MNSNLNITMNINNLNLEARPMTDKKWSRTSNIISLLTLMRESIKSKILLNLMMIKKNNHIKNQHSMHHLLRAWKSGAKSII